MGVMIILFYAYMHSTLLVSPFFPQVGKMGDVIIIIVTISYYFGVLHAATKIIKDS